MGLDPKVRKPQTQWLALRQRFAHDRQFRGIGSKFSAVADNFFRWREPETRAIKDKYNGLLL